MDRVPLALGIASIFFGFRVTGWLTGLLFFLAIAWLATTGMAFAAVRRRNFTQHREWMIRSYVVTFAFVTFRVFRDVAVANGLASFGEMQAVMAWACWAVPLLITEMWFQSRAIFLTSGASTPS